MTQRGLDGGGGGGGGHLCGTLGDQLKVLSSTPVLSFSLSLSLFVHLEGVTK